MWALKSSRSLVWYVRFANDDLVGSSSLSTDVLRCEHFTKCSGCFFNAGWVTWQARMTHT